MGNSPLRCASGGGREGEEVRKVRVLLPCGTIELLEGPVEAAELMMEHVSHMVMHCSALGSGAKGEHTVMTVLQPHEMLQPGQAYVVHPIPPPSFHKKTKLRGQPMSLPNPNLGRASARSQQNDENGEQNQENEPEKELSFKQRKQRFFLQRSQNRVVDSSQAQIVPQSTAGGVLGRHFVEEARKLSKELNDCDMDESKDDGDLVLLNLKICIGWRPALESIPESPRA